MLKNAALDAKIGFDPAENEPPKECCVVAGSAVLSGDGGGALEERVASETLRNRDRAVCAMS